MPANPATTTPPRRRPWSWLILLALTLGLWMITSRHSESATDVPYTTAYSWIDSGKVSEVTLKGDVLVGKLRAPETLDKHKVATFKTRKPEDPDLIKTLRAKDVTVRVESPESPLVLQLLYSMLPWVLIIGAWWWLSRRAQSAMTAGGGPLGGFLRRGRRFDKSTSPDVRFENVAGLSGAKRDLQEVVEFLREPERARQLGARVPRGVLLIGAPGTGKTLLARAVAGEAGVPFYSISASEFIEMFVGVGAARVRELFDEAKKHAPAIIFIDEIDAVGGARGGALGIGHDEREQTLNQLLAEMDGFDRSERIVVLAATNRPDVLDSALLRPGRFDRRVLVELPEQQARRAILAVHTKDKPLADDVDLQHLAEQTVGFSGADLANLANEAALSAVRRRSDTITSQDFATAYDKIVLGNPREGKLSDAEKRRVAVHESGHALVAWFTPRAAPIRRVSILPRGMALGATHQVPPEDRHLHTRSELSARLDVLLGGYAAEQRFLDDVSTGAEHDLKEATRLASNMVSHFGMSEALGAVYFEHREEHAFLGRSIAGESSTSDQTVHAIETEVRRLLGDALARARSLLDARRVELDRLVAGLIDHETLEHVDLVAMLGAPVEEGTAVPVAAPIPPTQPVVS